MTACFSWIPGVEFLHIRSGKSYAIRARTRIHAGYWPFLMQSKVSRHATLLLSSFFCSPVPGPYSLFPRVYRHIRAGSDGSHFFSDQGERSDAYRASASDERHRDEGKWPRPSGLRRKLGHTSLSASTLEPPKPSASASSGPIFARNAAHPYMSIHPSP